MGEWLVSQAPVVIKKHGRQTRSIFRTGFDFLRRLLLNLEQYADEFSQVLQCIKLCAMQQCVLLVVMR